MQRYRQKITFSILGCWKSFVGRNVLQESFCQKGTTKWVWKTREVSKILGEDWVTQGIKGKKERKKMKDREKERKWKKTKENKQ